MKAIFMFVNVCMCVCVVASSNVCFNDNYKRVSVKELAFDLLKKSQFYPNNAQKLWMVPIKFWKYFPLILGENRIGNFPENMCNLHIPQQ